MSFSVGAIGNGYYFPHEHLLHRIFNQHKYPGLSAVNSDGHGDGVPDANDCSFNPEGSAGKSERSKHKPLTSKEILEKLRRYGISGMLSYGLVNTAYYLTTFLVVWFYVAPAPAKIGYLAAAKRALAVAPFVDQGLSWFTVKFKFESQWKAFMAIVGFCLGLGIMVFVVVTLLWA